MQLGDRSTFPEAEIDTAIGDEIERGYFLCDAGRVIGGDLHDAVAEPDALRALARGREKDFRRGRMRILLQEVVFHLPGVIEPEAIRELDLVRGVFEQVVVG